ncbi:MAG: hypothetical protein R3B70_22090 [Polyangiaceae bacterium]
MSDHVRVEPLGKRLRVSLGGVSIVDTGRAMVVFGGGCRLGIMCRARR